MENNPIAKVQEDIYALILSTFRFSKELLTSVGVK